MILLMEFAQILYLICAKRLVIHDSFSRFSMQYYLFNNAVMYGEFPQWIPYLTHGATAAYWYGIISVNGLLLNCLFYIAPIFKNVNFFIISYAGIFFDKFILLVGVWLLSRRFFNTKSARFFVAVSVLGSSLWTSQTYFNFHLYYAIPLILHLGHSFLETGKGRYFFLTANFLLIQALGNIIYVIPMVSLSIFLYFFFFIFFNFKETVAQLKSLKWNFQTVSWILLTVICVFPLYAILKMGMDSEIVRYVANRNPDGTVPLNIFLTYSGQATPGTWLELFTGFSSARDFTLYIGILPVAMIFFCLFGNLNKRAIPLVGVIIVLYLISAGTFVAKFFYHVWPLMKYYRHLIQMSPLIRLFLCFLAGFGFESFSKQIQMNHKLYLKTLIYFIFSLSVLFFILPKSTRSIIFLAEAMKFYGVTSGGKVDFLRIKMISGFLHVTALKFGLMAIVLGIGAFLKREKNTKIILGVILCLQVIDVYSYAMTELGRRTVAIDQKQYEITRFQQLSYQKRRVENGSKGKNQLMSFNAKLLKSMVNYWTLNTILLSDQISTSFRTEYWQRPFDEYLKAYEGQSVKDKQTAPLSFRNNVLSVPEDHPGMRKISGLTEDKIQFFSRANILTDEEMIAQKISAPEYQGNVLFLSHPGLLEKDESFSVQDSLSADNRLPISYEVTRFESNHLEVIADNPEKNLIWMLYSDVWHPGWRATVNGKPSRVFQANLAYKAVRLEPGRNQIHLYYNSRIFTLAQRMLGINVLFWVGFILWTGWKIIFKDSN